MLNQKQCRKSEVPEPTPDKLGQLPLQSENAAPDVSVAGSLNTNIFYVELCFFPASVLDCLKTNVLNTWITKEPGFS